MVRALQAGTAGHVQQLVPEPQVPAASSLLEPSSQGAGGSCRIWLDCGPELPEVALETPKYETVQGCQLQNQAVWLSTPRPAASIGQNCPPLVAGFAPEGEPQPLGSLRASGELKNPLNQVSESSSNDAANAPGKGGNQLMQRLSHLSDKVDRLAQAMSKLEGQREDAVSRHRGLSPQGSKEGGGLAVRNEDA